MSRFDLHPTPLAGVTLLQRKPIKDSRGVFGRLFCADELRDAGFPGAVSQVNHSRTLRKGTVRGMHFQHAPHAEIKVVTCLRGEIFDVAVDLRHGSPTFLRWHGEILSEENARSLVIPEGFAHGFQTLAEDCEIVYVVSRAYCAEAESGIHPQDPAAGIEWPLAIAELSERDAQRAHVDSAFEGIRL